MARIENWYKQDLKKPVPIRRMETVFNQDALGHLFGVEVYDNGEAVALAGSVTGYCLLADGTTVPVAGTRSGNKASIIIPQTAYSVIGPITITVKLTEGTAITTLLAVVGMVARSRTGQQVDPGSTVTDWTNQISAQLQNVQTAADNLGSTLAQPFSTLTAYTAGTYVMNGGNLYRFTSDHAAGEWDSSHVTAVKLAQEVTSLNQALDTTNESAMLGTIPYAANGEITGTTANGGLSVVQNGHLITVDGTSTATSGQSTTKVSICEPLLAWRGSTSPTEWSASKPIKFIANHTYKFDIKKIGGTFGGTIHLRGYDANDVNIVLVELGVDIAEVSENYTPATDVNANFRLHYQRAVEFANATLQIDIYDITISSEVNGKQDALTFDTVPTENSTNPVTSGGVFSANADTIDRTQNMISPNVIAYWPDAKSSVTGSSGALTGVLNASELTMNCPTGTTSINALFKLDNEFIYNGRTNAQMSGSGGYVDTVARSLTLESGQKYRLSVAKVSGSYDGTESDNPDAVYLRAYVLQSGITSVADAVAFCSIDHSKEFTPQADSTAALVFIVYVKGVKLNNLTVKVYLEKVLASESSDDGDDTSIPSYYTDENTTLYGDYKNYLNYKIGAINANAENADDSLIFITDYHGVIANRNAGHSPALIKEITTKTGISKLVFGGDAGRTLTYTDYRRWTPAKESAAIYKLLGDSAPDFYAVIGNHEWNETQSLTSGKLVPHDYAYSETAVNQYYLTRENKPGIVMGTGGCYYFDNTYAKIRYFFLQCTGFAGLSNENCYWFGKQLESVPDGYAVLVFIHLGYLDQVCYIEGGVSKDYYSSLTPGTISGIVNLEVKRVSALLDAFQNQSASATVSTYDNGGASTGTMSFDYGNTNGSVIAVICGHTHRDMVLEKADNPDHVLVVATTTDSYGNNLDYNSSGVLVDRTVGTITEQAFDVVQIDLANKKLYMNRIGGGSDRELSFA